MVTVKVEGLNRVPDQNVFYLMDGLHSNRVYCFVDLPQGCELKNI